jgi:hypothetical protein
VEVLVRQRTEAAVGEGCADREESRGEGQGYGDESVQSGVMEGHGRRSFSVAPLEFGTVARGNTAAGW